MLIGGLVATGAGMGHNEALVWRNGELADLGAGVPIGQNERGQVIVNVPREERHKTGGHRERDHNNRPWLLLIDDRKRPRIYKPPIIIMFLVRFSSAQG